MPRFLKASSTTFAVLIGILTGPLIAQDCAVCKTIDQLENLVGKDQTAAILANPVYSSPASVSITGGDFCTSGNLAALSGDILGFADLEFGRAEQTARKIQECPARCAPTQKEAEITGYRVALEIRRKSLKIQEKGFGDAEFLFSGAIRAGRTVEEQLASQVALFGGVAFELLRDYLRALAKNDPTVLRVNDAQLSGREIAEFGQVLLSLSELGLARSDGVKIGSTLKAAGAAIASLALDVELALTRAALLNPKDRTDLQNRTLTAIADLFWAIDSLQQSGKQARAAALISPNTNATAIPFDTLLGGYEKAAQCLQKLTLSTGLAAEAITMNQDMLKECKNVSDSAKSEGQTSMLSLKALIANQAKIKKQASAVVGSMCVAK